MGVCRTGRELCRSTRPGIPEPRPPGSPQSIKARSGIWSVASVQSVTGPSSELPPEPDSVTHSYDLHGALDGDTNEGDTDIADLEPEENGSAPAPGALVAMRYDTRPISRDITFGNPVVDTRGAVSLCRY